MNQKYWSFPLLLLIVILTPMVSASIDCGVNPSFSITYLTSEIPTTDISVVHCSGNADTIVLSGQGTSHVSLIDTAISGEKDIKININQGIPIGFYLLSLQFTKNSSLILSIPLSIEIEEELVQQGDILVFPTSKIITVQQDSQKTQNILVTVPSSYPRTITIQSVDFNPGVETIRFGDLNLGQVSPGQSIQIPIVFDGTDAQVGTYQTGLSIFATDSEGQIDFPTINLQLQISTGVSPIDETTFSAPPTCSLSASNLNLNQSATFTCSGVVNNLEVHPQTSDYYIGITEEYNSNLYIYTFKPIKFGNTRFKADFITFRGSPIFSPFNSELRISSSSGQIPGTSLRLLFTPSLDKAQNNEVVVLQLIDNKTDSLVENPSIEVNAIPITNRSGNTFFYSFEVGRNYSIRGSSEGYNDLVTSISLTSKPIQISITPETGDTNIQFNITTDVNATIFIDGENKATSYFGTLTVGEHEIEAFKEGYLDAKTNITVESSIIFASSGECKKGVLQTFTINKNVSWRVSYQEDIDSVIELLSEGTGDKIEFEPNKVGTYILEAEDATRTCVIEGIDWNKKWWFMAWYFWIGGTGILIYLYFAYTSPSSPSGRVDVGFAGNPKY